MYDLTTYASIHQQHVYTRKNHIFAACACAAIAVEFWNTYTIQSVSKPGGGDEGGRTTMQFLRQVVLIFLH